jgi:NAD(P)-dependent dehydrogenase (short-subunit alcohol dehydrogenase family)
MELTAGVALVTGGASGLGRATAEHFAKAGAAVVLADLPSGPGAEAADRIGGRTVFAPCDVASEPDVEAALDLAASLGTLRTVVNCAGVLGGGRTVGRHGPHPLDEFSAVVRTNLIGTFNVIRLAARRIAAADEIGGERGVIINTASIAAFEGQLGQAAYAASKGGVVGLTLPVARDLAPLKIRVMTIAPGLFETPMVSRLPQAARDSLADQTQHPARLGDPAEFAALAAHIVANPLLNGEVIRLDGALRLAPR